MRRTCNRPIRARRPPAELILIGGSTIARRSSRLALAVALAAALGPAAAAADSWSVGPSSAQAHSYGVSAELPDGSIFVAGGDLEPTPVGELLGPTVTAASSFTTVGTMTQERFLGAAALLQNGDVLLAGGNLSAAQSTPVPATAEVWSPVTDTFTATGPMTVPREAFTLTALPDGDALAVGGAPFFTSGAGSPTAELYNPATNSWTPTGSMAAGRLGQTATLLPDCRVLIVGDNPTAETYDYVTGTFSPAGSEGAFQRSWQTATLLANGEVLIAGGEAADGTPLTSASVYNPVTGTFSPTANDMSSAHIQGFAARLPDGRVLVGGGLNTPGGSDTTDTVDIYDPATNSFTSAAPLPFQAVSSEADTLNDGQVIVLGAGDTANQTAIYTPSDLGPTVTPPPENCADLTNAPGPGTGGGTGGTGGGTGGTGGGTDGTGGSGTGGSGTAGSGTGGTGTGTAPGSASHASPAPAVFRLRSVRANSRGQIRIAIAASGAGRVSALATVPAAATPRKRASRRVSRQLSYGRASATAGHAQTITLTIKASRPARALLNQGRRLNVTVALTFTPAGGRRSHRTVRVTVRGHRPGPSRR